MLAKLLLTLFNPLKSSSGLIGLDLLGTLVRPNWSYQDTLKLGNAL